MASPNESESYVSITDKSRTEDAIAASGSFTDQDRSPDSKEFKQIRYRQEQLDQTNPGKDASDMLKGFHLANQKIHSTEHADGKQSANSQGEKVPTHESSHKVGDGMAKNKGKLSAEGLKTLDDWNKLTNEKLGKGTPETKLFQLLGAAVISGDEAKLEAIQKGMRNLKTGAGTLAKMKDLADDLPGATVQFTTYTKGERTSIEAITLTQRTGSFQPQGDSALPRLPTAKVVILGGGAITAYSSEKNGLKITSDGSYELIPIFKHATIGDAMQALAKAAKKK